MSNEETTYELYRLTKRFIERANACCEKDHSNEPAMQHFQRAIKIFDGLDRGYAERYEKEKNNESSS